MAKRKGTKKPAARVRNDYKDTVFRMLFKDRRHLAELYGAVSGRQCENPEELQIVTLENAIYMGLKNDMAFIVGFDLYLYEHQSTVNPNMPLRFLQYVVEEYGRLTADENLYGESLVKVPAPHFIVFYNGTRPQAEVQTLRLSAAYRTQETQPELELLVKVYNLNSGFNEELKIRCRILKEYMEYVDRVRKYRGVMPFAEAVEHAVDECIEEGILREFLLANRAEVIRMDIYHYDEEKMKGFWKKEGFEKGLMEGREEGIEKLIETYREFGISTEEARQRLAEKYGFSEKETESYVTKYWGI